MIHTLSAPRQPNIEKLQDTLFNRKTNLIPLIELGIDPYIKSKILGRPLQSLQDDVEFMYHVGYDFVKIQPQINFNIQTQNVAKTVESLNTGPATDRSWAPESEGIIKDWSGFESYPWPEKSEIDYSIFEDVQSLLPEGMGVIGQYGDIFTLAWEMMGFENFAMAIYEQPDLVSALFDKISDLILSMFDTMADMDWVNVLWYSDDIAYSSGLMINPDILRKYFFPILSHIGKVAEKRAIPFIYHSDGVLWDVMNDIIQSGVKALHPIEPKSMDMLEVKEKVGEKLCLCGGVEVDVLARGSEREVIDLVEKWLSEVGVKGGYCAGSSNSIPEYVNLDNYKAMVRTVLEYGQ
jgi:uroporphyrinogen decarboxylase